MSDILTGTPPRPHLRPRPGPPGVDGRLGHHLRRAGGHPRLDGPQPHHLRAPGPPAGGMAGAGPPPGARPRCRRIVALVVRPGTRRGRRRIRLRRRVPRRDRGRHAAVHPPHPDDRSRRRERGHGPASGRALLGLRLLRPLRHRADGPAPRPHRHPPGPGPDCLRALDIAAYGGLGEGTGSGCS